MPEDSTSKDSPTSAYRSRMNSLGLETKLEPGEQAAIDTDKAAFVIYQLVEGFNARQITEKLVLGGIDNDDAALLVNQIEGTQMTTVTRTRRTAGVRKIIIGVGCLTVGAAVSGVTLYLAASGGYFVATTGLFLVGAYLIVKGIVETAKG